jgi:hypothetical protein
MQKTSRCMHDKVVKRKVPLKCNDNHHISNINIRIMFSLIKYYNKKVMKSFEIDY